MTKNKVLREAKVLIPSAAKDKVLSEAQVLILFYYMLYYIQMQSAQFMDQSSLPTKTKTAAWAMIIVGMVCGISILFQIIFVIFTRIAHAYGLLFETPILLFLSLPTTFLMLFGAPVNINNVNVDLIRFFLYLFLSVLLVMFGHFLFKRKKWVWWGALFILMIYFWLIVRQAIIAMLIAPNIYLIPSFFVFVVLISLLLIDRKKYWEKST